MSNCRDPRDAAKCGVTFEELKRINERYADREPFTGNPAAALTVEKVVAQALARFTAQGVTESDVRAARVGAGSLNGPSSRQRTLSAGRDRFRRVRC
jgi:hypothetical protein